MTAADTAPRSPGRRAHVHDTHRVLRAAGRQPARAAARGLPAGSQGWQHGLQVFVRCGDEDQSTRLDELLWSFRAERFIPHEQYAEEVQAPVVIGLEQEPPTAGAC